MSKRWEELDQDEYMKYLDQAAYAIEHNLAKGDVGASWATPLFIPFSKLRLYKYE